ncbi:hypothetical protein ABTK80_20645, partial [Acinetobacter baumannii]
MLANSQGIAKGDYRLAPYSFLVEGGLDGFYSSYESNVQQIQSWQNAVNVPKTGFSFSPVSGFTGQDLVSYSIPAGWSVASVNRTDADHY